MTREEADELAGKIIGAPDTQPKPKEPPKASSGRTEQPGMLTEIQRGLRRGMVTGFTDTADLVGLGLKKGLETAGLQVDRLNLPSMTSLAERGLNLPSVSTPTGRIAEGIGAGVSTGGGGMLLSTGKTALKAGVPLAKRAIPLATETVRGAALGGTAGGTAQTAVEVARNFTNDPIILAGIGLSGGLAGGRVAHGIEALGKAAGSLVPSVRRRILQGQIERIMAGQIPDMGKTMAQAEEAMGLAQKIPGYHPAITELVPGVQSASRQLRKADPAITARQQERIEGNLEAIVKQAETLAGRLPSGTPDSARKSLQHRHEALQAAEEAKIARVHDEFTEALRPIREEVGDLPNAAQYGEKMRNSVNTHFEDLTKRFEDAYKELSLGVEVDPTISRTALETLESGIKKAEAEDLPSIFVRDLIRNFGRKQMPTPPGVKPVLRPVRQEPLQEIIAVRSRLLREIMQEKGQTVPNQTKLRLANQLLDGLQENIDTVIANTPNAALKDLNAQYRTFKQIYAADPVDDLFAMSRAGLHKATDTDVFHKLTQSGKGKELDHFQNLINATGQGEAERLMGEALFAKMLMTSGVKRPDGTFNPKAVEKFISDHEALINRLPTVQRPLQHLKETANRAATAPKRLPTLEDFDNSFTRAIMGEDPSRATTKIVESGNMGEGLQILTKAFGSEPAAFRAIARPMWDALFEQAGLVRPSRTTMAGLDHKEMGKLLAKHEDALRKFYGNESYEGLVEIQRAARLNAETPTRIDPEMGVEKSSFAGILKTFWSRSFAIARGVIGAPFASAEVLSRRVANLIDAFDEKEIRIIMDNMLHDKDLIGILTKVENVQGTLQAQRDLKRWVKTNVVPTVGAVSVETMRDQ